MLNRTLKLLAAIALATAFCSCNQPDAPDVNLALNRSAAATSSYDYNLTAQLVTDGIMLNGEPSWLKVSTSEGEIARREREWTLDSGPFSNNKFSGPSNFLEYKWSNQRFSASCVRITGTLVHKQMASGWAVECFAGTGNLVRVGGIAGRGLPGNPAGIVTVTDPNKQAEKIDYPSHRFDLAIPLEHAGDFGTFRIEFRQDSTLSWEINAVDFTDKPLFGKSKDTGPYDSKEARGYSVLPADSFTSAWMSADDKPQQITIDLGGESKFSQVNVHWVHEAEVTNLEVSDDGEKWKKVMVLPHATDALPAIARIKGGRGRYVRLSMDGADSTGHFAISEIQVMGKRMADRKHGEEDAAEAVAGNQSWRLQRISEVRESGEEISAKDYDATGWIKATVPGTVLRSYVDAGAVPEPGVEDNMNQISESFFHSDFWYRGEICTDSLLPRGQKPDRYLLELDGINWKSEVFMNGCKVGEIAGAFKQGVFDVTDLVRQGGTFNKTSIVAVHIFRNANFGAVKEKNKQSPDFNGGVLGADNPTFHATVGWDWIPTVRGRDSGIWNDVRIRPVKAVVPAHPLVRSKVDAADTTASMTFDVDLTNYVETPVAGTLVGTIDDIEFSKDVVLGARESRKVTFTPEEFQQLRNRKMSLWWPNGYGEPDLHGATFTFVAEGDTFDRENPDLKYHAGIREFSYGGEMTALQMYINGRRFIPKGGNWGFGEFLLRFGETEYNRAVEYHKEMNMNMIRNWVGQIGDEEFYDACDRNGIVVWQDFWLANPYDGPDPDDEEMFADNARDYVSRIRSHASIGLYCGRNEGFPPASLNARLVETVRDLHPGIIYIPNSAEDGVSGHGPYRAMEPDGYFEIPAPKFHTERGMPAVLGCDALELTLGKDHLWPMDDVWGQHDFTLTGAQGGSSFFEMTRQRFGEDALKDAETFAKWAQWINYDGYRAMYEANNVNRQGLLIWMSHSCWPSLSWQTYDYWFNRTSAYYGARKGCEPVHVQLNPAAMQVEVVNASCGRLEGLTTTIRVCDKDEKEVYSKTALIESIEEDTTRDVIDYSDVPDGPCIVRLTLTNTLGEVLSENIYFRNYRGGKDVSDYRELLGCFDKYEGLITQGAL